MTYGINILFLIETAVKILTFGLIFTKSAYLYNIWNWIDLGLSASIILFLVFKINYNWTIIRVLELIPLFKKQKRLQRLNYMISSILKSLKQIIFVVIITALFILIFSIIGKSTFTNVYTSFCIENSDKMDYSSDLELCEHNTDCPEGWNCISSLQLNSELYTNFDKLNEAMIAIFQISSLEGWEKLLVTISNVYSKWFSIIFYVACVITCGYFSMNLTLPILREYYFIYATKGCFGRSKNSTINKKLV